MLFKKGHIPWIKGKTKNDYPQIMRISNSKLGNKNPAYRLEVRNKIRQKHIGKKLSEEHKRKIGLKNKGKKLSEETKRKISNAQKGEKSHQWKGGLIEIICQICGKIKKVKKCDIKRERGKYCSRKCYYISRKGKYKGEKSPAWKGGVTPIKRIIRDSIKYIEWRQKVYIKDNFTCQKCGYKGRNLEAHHKKSVNKLLEECKFYLPLLDLYEASMIYTPLWDINNGITLCEFCHKSLESKARQRR